jgi:hypothetical protein
MTKTFLMTMLALMASTLMFAQYMQVDFEPAGVGAEWAWTVGEDADNPALEFVANPAAGGANTSATVAKFNARQSGQAWALCFTDDIEPFQFDNTNTTITIMVYKTAISNVGIKFEGTSPAAEVDVPNTQVNQWETITFNFSAFVGNSYDRLIVIPDFVARPADRVVYFDNIQLPDGNVAPVPEPETPAPTPTYNASDVISLFSNAYTNVTVDTWSADWDVADVSDLQVQGDDIKRYTGLSFAGIEFTNNLIDATNMAYFHMDVWTPNDTESPNTFKVKLVDFGADGAYSGGDDVESELTFGSDVMATEAWVSLDIPLTSFTTLTTRQHLAQIVLSGTLTTVYLDNIYFRANVTGPATPTAPAPTPSYAAGNVISLFSDAYTNVNVDTWSATWDQANVSDIQIDGNNTKLYTSVVYAGIEMTSSPINATSMTNFQMNVWTPDAVNDTTEFRVKLVDFGADGVYGGGDDVEGEQTFHISSLTSQSWMTLNFAISGLTGLTTRQHLAQIVISSDFPTFYIDNVIFYTSGSAVDDGTHPVAALRLDGNYPNPFNPTTSIRFSLDHSAKVALNIYDIQGRHVTTLVNSTLSAGSHEVVWNAVDVPSGVYFCALSSGNQTLQTRRMTLLK